MNQFDGLARVTKTVATSTALNPTLMLAALLGLPCFLLGFFSPVPISYLLDVCGVAVLVTAIWQIIRFTIHDPDRLQNDRHVENKMMISTLGGKFGDEKLEIAIPANAISTANPHMISGEVR